MLEALSYHAGEVTMTGFLADGSSGARAPGVLIAHEAAGLDTHAKQRAEMLAELGFVALAMDLYAAPFSIEKAIERHEHVMATPNLIRERARAALDVLAGHAHVDEDRLAVIGFCQGGVVAAELARGGAPVKAAVGFHPGLKKPAGSQSGPISAKVLMMIGDSDPIVPDEDRRAFADEMDASGADWQLHVFGGVGHTFTNPAVDALAMPGFRYNADADRRSWRMMLALLGEVFEQRDTVSADNAPGRSTRR